LACNQGMIPSKLAVASQNFSTVEGMPVATEQDKQAMVNIKPSGQCMLKPTDTVNNYRILTEESFCMCVIGGKIEVSHKEHGEKHGIT